MSVALTMLISLTAVLVNNGTDIGRGNNNGACNDNGITMAFTMALTINLCQWQITLAMAITVITDDITENESIAGSDNGTHMTVGSLTFDDGNVSDNATNQ